MAFAAWSPRPTSSTSTSLSATLNGESSSTVTDEMDNIKTKDLLSLQSIRNSLIRQEETIIFALIERAQYRRNSIVYENGGFGDLGIPTGSTPIEGEDSGTLSFLEYMLVGTEALHCAVRRYTSPEEHAFFPERLPSGQMEALPRLQYPQDLLSSEGSSVNFNKILLKQYIEKIVPSLTKQGDDEQHGSTVLADIAVLQALSRRIHYGKFVAESK
jgi:chorismate mutase